MAEECKEVRVIITGGNDWSIVAKKFIYGLLASFAAVGVPYTVEFLQTEDLSSLPAWFVGLVPLIVGVLLALQNAWVHRQKIEFVTPGTPK